MTACSWLTSTGAPVTTNACGGEENGRGGGTGTREGAAGGAAGGAMRGGGAAPVASGVLPGGRFATFAARESCEITLATAMIIVMATGKSRSRCSIAYAVGGVPLGGVPSGGVCGVTPAPIEPRISVSARKLFMR